MDIPHPTYLASHYHGGGVAASFLLAMLASYAALGLGHRLRLASGPARTAWWTSGAAVLGTGIWAAHFQGMQAFSLPIALYYQVPLTVFSWAAAVAACAVALGLACTASRSRVRLVMGALAMAAGVCAMHYLGMAAVAIVPGIQWHMGLVTASLMVAPGFSLAALWLASRRPSGARGPAARTQVQAAALLGAGICGMHYLGMEAARFPEGAVCVTEGLGGGLMGMAVYVSALALLLATVLVLALEARFRSRTESLSHSLRLSNNRLKLANMELQRQAFTDELTQLSNRHYFEAYLAKTLRKLDQAPAGRELVVLSIHLGGFGAVNTNVGHATGDEIVRIATGRLRALAGSSDLLSRHGLDGFLLLIEQRPTAAATTADQVIDALRAPYQVHGRLYQLSCSVGQVCYPGKGQRDRLVANAELAMQGARRLGGNRCLCHEARMSEESSEQFELLDELRGALGRGEFVLHYQPKIDCLTGTLAGVEALLRWQHPIRGPVSPAAFIPLAERAGLIGAIGDWVIDEACRQIAVWREEGLTIKVAVNVSMHQLLEDGLPERVAFALQRWDVDPSLLLCEITESSAMGDVGATQRAFEGLAQLGVYLSIDDFGTGYSSLSYLRELPARQLKIDRSFVRDVEANGNARAVVEAVVRLAHALGLRVVAEGVETQAQVARLQELRCDELQGYLFARPMAAGMLPAWLERELPAAFRATPSAVAVHREKADWNYAAL